MGTIAELNKKVKRCPHCSSWAQINFSVIGGVCIVYFVQCKKCGSKGGSSRELIDAFLLWQDRKNSFFIEFFRKLKGIYSSHE